MEDNFWLKRSVIKLCCLFTYSFYIFSGEEIEDVGQDRDSNKPTFATRGRGSNRRYRARFIRRAGGGRFQNYKDGGDRDVSIFKLVIMYGSQSGWAENLKKSRPKNS